MRKNTALGVSSHEAIIRASVISESGGWANRPPSASIPLQPHQPLPGVGDFGQAPVGSLNSFRWGRRSSSFRMVFTSSA
ncbi:MAG: hypothetical protein LUQ65_01670, partial [Candidatus Helarchaeota archaeon]|nr:hypothetical protein [Candidatus Helarchaeota archaeon]